MPDDKARRDFNGSEFARTLQREHTEMQGVGYLWSRRVPRPPNPDIDGEAMRKAILNRHYDLIIYRSDWAFHTPEVMQVAYLEEAVQAIGYRNIIIFAGSDWSHPARYFRNFVSRGGHFFSREVKDIVTQPECSLG
jgi:hypothetical protein